MTKTPPRESTGSALLKTVEGVELWLSSTNRLFCKFDGKTFYPSLRGSFLVTFDDPRLRVSDAVKEAVRTVLRKQREIRSKYWAADTYAADDVAFQYS